ncbi:MAG: DUF4399 domain-containing protein [Pseudomonadota bacterium]
MRLLTILVLAACLAACGKETPPQEPAKVVDEAQTPATDSAPAVLPRSASAEGAAVFFITPTDGDTVTNPVTIEFGIAGMEVVPAGNNAPNSGHHHLLIDTGLPDLGLPIPADAQHVHFGDGSTSTEITLGPGEHTLQMLLGDHLHIPHDPPLASDVITITVEDVE